MPSMIMTVQLINPPANESDRGSLVGTDGTRLGLFREKVRLFEVGKTYEIEHTEGKYKNVRNAKQVAAPPVAPSSPSPAQGGGGNYYRPTSPEDSERMFVCSLMNAFIQAGKIEPEQGRVIRAINVLREAYHATFGSDGAMQQAAE